ncbi:helix-turn-helix domain-containing protein [Streptomyces sp. CSDS2]|uniref:helix-turn-helix domain-containing protein n=1 Tax=Streptomyces sp. CSDS2 TaxID=3055051 RepID=UPI0025B0DF36|nr:helix-turn-helix domain-containing protein [Streptomyces sp. CSDS2]MDN3264566.1 helix-turn-helix domain-containing protein [Streptomyces sp. CSDS2]
MAGATFLCASCCDSLAQILRALPRLHEECGRLLAGAGRPRERTGGGTGTPRGIPLNTAAVEVRAGILATLASWSGLMVEGSGEPGPKRSVPELARWLLARLPRFAAHPAVGDFSAELHRLAAAARDVVSPGGSQRVEVGRCVEARCDGRLVARSAAGPGGLGEIRCDSDPEHRWVEHEWPLLHRRMAARDRGTTGGGSAAVRHWLTPQDVSRLWGVPMGSVYRLASEHEWGRTRRAGRSYYDEADVRRTLDARMPASRST